MKNFTQKEIRTLFSGLCCSRCKNDFTKDSIEILERFGDILVCRLTCKKCAKDFGEIVFNFNRKSDNHTPLNVVEGADAITFDDVIDAHNFIKKHL